MIGFLSSFSLNYLLPIFHPVYLMFYFHTWEFDFPPTLSQCQWLPPFLKLLRLTMLHTHSGSCSLKFSLPSAHPLSSCISLCLLHSTNSFCSFRPMMPGNSLNLSLPFWVHRLLHHVLSISKCPHNVFSLAPPFHSYFRHVVSRSGCFSLTRTNKLIPPIL